jgi:hypothetical protein
MTEHDSPTPVIRDLPWLTWFFGLVLVGFAVLAALAAMSLLGPARKPDHTSNFFPMLLAVLFGLGSLLVFSLASVLTITADRARSFLTLTYRSPLRKTVKEIPLHQIASIDIEIISGGRGPNYRVVVTESDGQMTPLRYASSVDKKDLASRLRELTGVGGSTMYPQNRQHAALIAPYAKMRETAGVCWHVQSIDMGGTPVTRWFSPDYKTKATFVYLAQKPASQKSFRGMIGRTAMRVSMGRYGFAGKDVPGLDGGDMLVLDPRLERDFLAFSPDPAEAGRILNPRVIELLDDWAERHPLKTIQVAGKSLGQLVVLYSPHGVYAAAYSVNDSSQLEELIDTGVQLVKAQRRSTSGEPGHRPRDG